MRVPLYRVLSNSGIAIYGSLSDSCTVKYLKRGDLFVVVPSNDKWYEGRSPAVRVLSPQVGRGWITTTALDYFVEIV